MKTYSSKEVIEILEANGWTYKTLGEAIINTRIRQQGKKVPIKHPVKTIPIGTLKSISRQTGIKF